MLKIQHSIIHPGALLNEIQTQYPTIGAIHCELLALGCNDNYLIKTKHKQYALRVYRYNWWPEQDIDEELRFLEVLCRKHIKVCKPVRNRNKQRSIPIDSAEGQRYAALFEFLPGRPLGHNFGKRNCNIAELGGITADIHNVADTIKTPIQRWNMDFDAMVNPFLDAAPNLIPHREKDIAYVEKLANTLKGRLHDLTDASVDVGLCHGDLHTFNVMLQDDGVLAIFDFDWCGYSWRGYDLATVWWTLPRDQKSLSVWRAFLRAYQQKRKISVTDKKLLPWYVILRQFELLSFHVSNRKNFGSAWQNDNYFNNQIGFFKYWLKQHRDLMM